MARWKLLQRRNVKFPHSKLYTVSEKTLYHQRYSTGFQKLSFCWKMWKIGIWEENFMSGAIIVLQLQCENFFQVEKFEISHIQAAHCVRKMLYHQRYSNDFQKLSFCWKMSKIAISTEKILSAAILVLPRQGENFFQVEIRNFPHSNCTLWHKKRYITKGIQPIFKNFPSAERCGKYVFGLKRSWAQLFWFCMVNTFFRWNNLKFPTFKLYTVSKKCYITKGIQPIFKNFPFA